MNDLKLRSFRNDAELEKDVPVAPPEVVTKDDLRLEEKHATMYQNRLYTVVPKQHNLSLGILPEDQGFSSKVVILWDTYRDLVLFDEEIWRKVMVELPEAVKRTDLVKWPGAAYALPSVPNTWRITDEPTTPRYVE